MKTRKQIIKELEEMATFVDGGLFTIDCDELADYLLAQKEDRKECTCLACKEGMNPTPSPLEGFQVIEEIDPEETDLDLAINALIFNQKKLYQYIKEKKI